MACIYEIRNLINGKIYIGSSRNFETRKETHLRQLKNNKHFNVHLQRAWNKHGEKNFEFVIIEIVSDLLQYSKEQEHIDKFKDNLGKLYNISTDVYQPSIQKPMTKICGISETGDFHVYSDSCGKEFITRYANQKYCDICSNKFHNIYNEHRENRKRAIKEDENAALLTQHELNVYLDYEDGECLDPEYYANQNGSHYDCDADDWDNPDEFDNHDNN